MRSKKVNKNVIVMIIVLFITLGYAYLNSELKINGTTGIAGNTWDVHFENVVPSTDNTVTPTIAPVANPSDKVTELTYSVLFNKPGDVYEFEVDIVNAGSIDAMVELITSTIKIGNGEVQELNNSTLPSYLNYYVKYSDGVNISSNHLLNKESRETIKVHVEYKSDISSLELEESAGKVIEFTYGLAYGQASRGAKPRPLANNCIYNGTMYQGATYTNGQYTYGYMQEGSSSGWSNITNDGWGVKLTNSNSTDPVNTPLCTSINGKPIVSMSYMFYGSKASSIDLSSFDTSNVTNMQYMFTKMPNITSLDVGYLDTSNVTNMDSMFNNNSVLENIDNLDNLDTKNVVNMYYMFASSKKIKNIKITKWDVSKVTNANYMFYEVGYNSQSINFEVSNFNLSSVTSVSNMFSYVGYSAGDVDIIIDNISMEYVTNNGGKRFNYICGSFRNSCNINISDIYMNSLSNVTEEFASMGNSGRSANVNFNNINVNGAANLDSIFYSIGRNTYEFNLTITNVHAHNATNVYRSVGFVGQVSNKVKIKVKDWETPNLTSAASMFDHSGQSVSDSFELTLDNIDMDNITTTKNMFYSNAEGNNRYAKITIKNINTPNLTNVSNMFMYAGSVTYQFVIDGLDNFDFSNVRDFDSMFYGAGQNNAYGNLDIGTIDVYGGDLDSMFSNFKSVKAILNIHNKPTNYNYTFSNAATNSGASIVVNYSSEVDNIDDIIATKSDGSNVIKGQLID